MAAEVFTLLPTEQQSRFIAAATDKELVSILDEIFLDDMVDIVEEMPNDDDDLGTHVRFMVPTGMRVDDVRYESGGKEISVDRDVKKSVSVRWNGEVVSIMHRRRRLGPVSICAFT